MWGRWPSAAARSWATRFPARPASTQLIRTWVFGHRFGIPFWWVGEFTTHFRTYFSGDWDRQGFLVRWSCHLPELNKATCREQSVSGIATDLAFRGVVGELNKCSHTRLYKDHCVMLVPEPGIFDRRCAL